MNLNEFKNMIKVWTADNSPEKMISWKEVRKTLQNEFYINPPCPDCDKLNVIPIFETIIDREDVIFDVECRVAAYIENIEGEYKHQFILKFKYRNGDTIYCIMIPNINYLESTINRYRRFPQKQNN